MLGFVSHPACLDHDAGPDHPDTPARLEAITNQLLMSGLDFVLVHHDAPRATRAQLARVHDAGYLDRVFAADPGPGGAAVEIDGDTVMSPGTLEAALRAAGSGVLAAELTSTGRATRVFCAVRPPGHHAERDRAMGFCLFNNAAVAAAHALEALDLSRVAIVDFDVHHGNGTEDIFRGDPRVLFCSAFQHPFYPFTGHGSDTANLVDVPLSAGTRGAAFRAAIAEHWLPALDAFRPELVIASAGFDAHVLDDMSALALTEEDYAWLGTELMRVATDHAGGRLLSLLEGGYEPGALARSVVAYLRAQLG